MLDGATVHVVPVASYEAGHGTGGGMVAWGYCELASIGTFCDTVVAIAVDRILLPCLCALDSAQIIIQKAAMHIQQKSIPKLTVTPMIMALVLA